MTTVTEAVKQSTSGGANPTEVIDCDIHPILASQDELKPFMS